MAKSKSGGGSKKNAKVPRTKTMKMPKGRGGAIRAGKGSAVGKPRRVRVPQIPMLTP